jgi:Asp/Glu/hydantoin racemase
MSDRILVINPNSTEAVTRGIDAAMEPLRMQGGPAIECVTLKDGPPGIENQGHVEQVVPLIGAMVKQRDGDCSAFVIACYSDPGLHAARELTTRPVLGIAECGILTALTLGQRLASSRSSASLSPAIFVMSARWASTTGWPATARSVSASWRSPTRRALSASWQRFAAELRDEDGADVLVMGCAGMARYRERLQRHVGLPVVEPSQAAVAMAIGRTRLNWS